MNKRKPAGRPPRPKRAKVQRTAPHKDEDDLTPAERRDLARSIKIGQAQLDAGLSYGPFDAAKSILPLIKAGRRTRPLTLQVPSVLLTYLDREAKRLGMTLEELVVTILKTHRFADRDAQLITLAIAQSTGSFKTGRYEK